MAILKLNNPVGKICSKCEKWLPLNKFHKRTTTKDGLSCYCKNCGKLHSIERKYKLSPEQYNKLFNQQKGRCLICNEQKKLCVDHNHKTNKVRGLLCTRCNTALGKYEDWYLRYSIIIDNYLRKERIENGNSKRTNKISTS